MLTKLQVALLKSIDSNSSAVLSHDRVSGKVFVISGDYRKPVRYNTFLALREHLVQVKSGYSSIAHYKAK